MTLKEDEEKGKKVLYLSVRRREIEAKEVPFYREKGHLNKAIKVIFPSKEREGASPIICFYHQQNVKAEWISDPIGIRQHPKD